MSLFDGIGCFWLSFLPLIAHGWSWVRTFSSESNAACQALLAHRFPGLVHLGDIRSITLESLKEAFKGLDANVLVVGGGSPCTNISRAGDKKGLAGKDSSLFFEFVRVLDLCIDLCDEMKWTLHFVFEMVVPQDVSIARTISEYLCCGLPILVDGADFGWCTRRRLFWTSAKITGALLRFISPPPSAPWRVFRVPHSQRLLPALGKIFRSSYQPRWLSGAATRAYPEGRLPVITNRLWGAPPNGRDTASREVSIYHLSSSIYRLI